MVLATIGFCVLVKYTECFLSQNVPAFLHPQHMDLSTAVAIWKDPNITSHVAGDIHLLELTRQSVAIPVLGVVLFPNVLQVLKTFALLSQTQRTLQKFFHRNGEVLGTIFQNLKYKTNQEVLKKNISIHISHSQLMHLSQTSYALSLFLQMKIRVD